jgi:hypothetical protein
MNNDLDHAIEALLAETEAAHAVYEREELSGVYDEAWPAWYAEYAVDHGLGEILGRDVTAPDLAAFMTGAWEERKAAGSEPDEPWSTWMARRLAAAG